MTTRLSWVSVVALVASVALAYLLSLEVETLQKRNQTLLSIIGNPAVELVLELETGNILVRVHQNSVHRFDQVCPVQKRL